MNFILFRTHEKVFISVKQIVFDTNNTLKIKFVYFNCVNNLSLSLSETLQRVSEFFGTEITF